MMLVDLGKFRLTIQTAAVYVGVLVCWCVGVLGAGVVSNMLHSILIPGRFKWGAVQYKRTCSAWLLLQYYVLL
jgi:hypothetical protein